MEPTELQAVLKTAEACAVRMRKGGKGGKGPKAATDKVHLHLYAHEDDASVSPDRRFRASVSCEIAGDYQLHILMQPNHQPLKGSPIEMHISPAIASASQSVVHCKPSEKRMLAGEKRTFTVRAHDTYGNPCTQGGAKLAVSVPEAVQCAVIDLLNGTYEVGCANASEQTPPNA